MRAKFLIPALAAAALALTGAAAVHARTSARRTSALPYYADSTLTPKWIASGSRRLTAVHRAGEFRLVAQDGHTATARELDGKVYVAHFFYTTCGDVCPLTTRNLARFLAAFPGDDRVRIASFSVAGDSAASLAEYAARHGLDAHRWLLFGGSKADVARIARESYFVGLGRGKDFGTDSVAHTDLVVLVDADRHIRGVYNASLRLEVEQLTADARTLLAESSARRVATLTHR